jgi:hypothetical protein
MNEQEDEHRNISKIPAFIITTLALCSTVLFTNKTSLMNMMGGLPTTSDLSSSSSSSTHKLKTNRKGYEPLSQHTLKVYGLDHVVETDCDVVLKISTCDDESEDNCDGDACEDCDDLSWEITPLGKRGSVKHDEAVTGRVMVARFTDANAKFSLKAYKDNQVVVDETLTTKFIKRELRTLTTADRDRYFNAVYLLYTIDQEEGEELFGKEFLSYQHLVALHNTKDYQYHDNLFFLTSHPAMQTKFEKSLLSIDNGIVLPYWDFMRDASLGRDWASSEIYSLDMFGPVSTSEKDNYRPRGRFHDVKYVMDKDEHKFPNAHHGPRGYLSTDTMTSSSTFLQRSDTYCGFKSVAGQVSCENLITCFDNFETDRNLRQFDMCMEYHVHASIHMMHAGQWDCGVDWAKFYKENEDWVDEYSLSVIAVLLSTITDAFYYAGRLSCPSSCDDTETSSCACESSLDDISSIEDIDEAYSMKDRFDLLTDVWSALYSKTTGGHTFIKLFESYELNGETYSNIFLPVNTKQGVIGEAIDSVKLDLLNSLMLKTIFFPGNYGIMRTGAASNDPLFWVMHPIFDKAMHAMRLSPKYNSEGFEWNNVKGDIKWEGMTPFTRLDFEPYLGAGSKTKGKYLKNSELWEIIHPTSEATYYIYDQMTNWGACEYDLFKE